MRRWLGLTSNKVVKMIDNFDCFMAGHKVITNRGIVNIEDIKVGDMVLSHDLTYNVVNKVNSHIHSGNLLTFTIKNIDESVTCTPEHKFLTFESGWLEAKNITFDHHILLANMKDDDVNSYSEIVSISASYDVVEMVYNLCIDKTHSYAVNNIIAYGDE